MAAGRLLTPRFERAFALACEVHAIQVRKGTTIPYLAHLLAVTALVLEAGGGEDCAIAALLHDSVEDSRDGKAMLDRIRSDFGDRVAAIVAACSDATAIPGRPKPDWRPRKEAHLEHLRAEEDPEILLVSACDKLHNARSTVSDLRADGPVVWERFRAGRDDQLWYYGSLNAVYSEKSLTIPRGGELLGRVAEQLAGVVAEMRSLADS